MNELHTSTKTRKFGSTSSCHVVEHAAGATQQHLFRGLPRVSIHMQEAMVFRVILFSVAAALAVITTCSSEKKYLLVKLNSAAMVVQGQGAVAAAANKVMRVQKAKRALGPAAQEASYEDKGYGSEASGNGGESEVFYNY